MNPFACDAWRALRADPDAAAEQPPGDAVGQAAAGLARAAAAGRGDRGRHRSKCSAALDGGLQGGRAGVLAVSQAGVAQHQGQGVTRNPLLSTKAFSPNRRA